MLMPRTGPRARLNQGSLQLVVTEAETGLWVRLGGRPRPSCSRAKIWPAGVGGREGSGLEAMPPLPRAERSAAGPPDGVLAGQGRRALFGPHSRPSVSLRKAATTAQNSGDAPTSL